LLTVSRSFMNVANSVLWRMAIILKDNKVNLFLSNVLFVFWYHSPNVLDPPRSYWHGNLKPYISQTVQYVYKTWFESVPYWFC
jgi:hypothetical protein